MDPLPAACNAAAALLNLVGDHVVRQRMMDAGIAAVLQAAMRCPRDNLLVQRCRLLGNWLGLQDASHRLLLMLTTKSGGG